jgi:PAS domain S-box-containing protein
MDISAVFTKAPPGNARIREALRLLRAACAEQRRENDALRSEIAGHNQRLEAGRISEERCANVFRLSPDAMAISRGMQGPLLDVNDRWQELFGYQRGEVIGRTPAQLHLYADGQDIATMFGPHSDAGFIRDLEVDMRDRHGAILNTVLSGGRMGDGDAACFISFVRDVTEQRRREQELRRQREQLTHLSRVVVLGELAGALVHELNQPLAAILTNAQAGRRFLQRVPADLDEVREILDDIVDEDKRAGNVIRRLRALFMKGEPVLQPLDLNELVRDALTLTRSALNERKVSVALALGAPLPVVHGDRVQLQQVLLNLIVNASEAMSEVPPAERRLALATCSSVHGNVQLAVTDSGPGIPAEAIDKVFDSFFTTKARGLGFGLSISRTIIVAHGGHIEAANNPDGGATFRVTMPANAGGWP